jgi:hypothetical protein
METKFELKILKIVCFLKGCFVKTMKTQEGPQYLEGIVSQDFGTLSLISLDRFEVRNRAG